jgi:hypothetical protein
VYQLIGRWVARIVFGFAVTFVLSWVGDWTVFHLRGKPTSTVIVHRYMGVPLKGQKEEYDFLGDFTVMCSISLFPQDGNDPCWHLSSHPDQWQNL